MQPIQNHRGQHQLNSKVLQMRAAVQQHMSGGSPTCRYGIKFTSWNPSRMARSCSSRHPTSTSCTRLCTYACLLASVTAMASPSCPGGVSKKIPRFPTGFSRVSCKVVARVRSYSSRSRRVGSMPNRYLKNDGANLRKEGGTQLEQMRS